MHKVPKHILDRPMTIDVVGAGGNGSMFLPHLARICRTMEKLGRTERIHVRVWDNDTVTESNLGRQAYSEADVGRNKAVIAVTRINLFFGLRWEAVTQRYKGAYANLTVTCVDNLATRREVWRRVDGAEAIYWLDLGNGDTFGQVVLSGCGLPSLFDLQPHLEHAKEDTQTPSCSVAESLARQDLFINSTVANFAGQIVWSMLRKGELQFHGYYINLASGRVAPLPVPPDAEPQPPEQSDSAPRVPRPRHAPVDVRPRRKGNRARAVR